MPQSFCVKYAGLERVLKNDVGISVAFDPATGGAGPAIRTFTALWDTGATASVVMQSVIDQCGLKPTGMVEVHGVHGSELAETFLVNIYLPNRVAVQDVQVTKGKVVGADVLIGMDIIGIGSFAVSNFKGRTVFTFKIPSDHDIDFVPTDNFRNTLAQQLQNRQSRRGKPKANKHE